MQMRKDREAVSGEHLSNVALSKLFKKYAFKPVKGQEEISETFIENAFYIGNRALCYPEVPFQLLS